MNKEFDLSKHINGECNLSYGNINTIDVKEFIFSEYAQKILLEKIPEQAIHNLVKLLEKIYIE